MHKKCILNSVEEELMLLNILDKYKGNKYHSRTYESLIKEQELRIKTEEYSNDIEFLSRVYKAVGRGGGQGIREEVKRRIRSIIEKHEEGDKERIVLQKKFDKLISS